MEQHRKNPACMSCHRVIDPLGLTLENFDVTGKYRIKDSGNPVDANGVLYDGTEMEGPAGLKAALIKNKNAFLLSFTESFMTYALGRRVMPEDMPTVRRIVREAEKHDYKLSSFVMGVASEPRLPDEHAAGGRTDHRRRCPLVAPVAVARLQEPDMPVLTKRHLPRRTMLKGMGAAIALPFLDAMLPAGTALAKALPAKRRLIAMEMVHGSAGSTAFGAKQHLWAPAEVGAGFDLTPSAMASLEPYRDYLTIVSNTDVNNAEAFTAPEIGGDHFRSAAVFLTQAHPKQTQGSDIRSGTSIDQLVRAEDRDGNAHPVDAAVHRERRPGGRLFLWLLVRLHRLDQLGLADRAAADDSRPARWCSTSCSASAPPPRPAPAGASATCSLLDFVTGSVDRLKLQSGHGRPGPALAITSTTCARSSGASRRSRSMNSSGEQRALPGAPRRRARFLRRARQADVRHAGAGLPVRRDARVRLQVEPRRVEPRVSDPTGVNTGFHIASHHGEREDRILDLAKINKYHVSLVPYLLEKLKDTPDGDGATCSTTR